MNQGTDTPLPPPRSTPGRGLVALLIAAVLWLPLVHLPYRVDPATRLPSKQGGITPFARQLMARHLALWTDPARRKAEIDRMRRSNAEWDFMGRTYLVLSLANLALRDPAETARVLPVIDAILDETLKIEADSGHYFFLLPYARNGPFVQQPVRSQFVDSEVAMMLGVRLLLADDARQRTLLRDRVELIRTRMRASPSLNTESYPDECWLFDNANALAATRIADALLGTDHSTLRRDWVARARELLVHAESGLLVSSYTFEGRPMDGPEGSSIWQAAHALQLVDPTFAADQYRRARDELRVNLLGFGYAREWPPSWRGARDIDAGMVLPVLDASPASSGLALVGARAFGDDAFLGELLTSLEMVAFPVLEDGALRYRGSNQVGDAVLLYSTLLGPAWAEVERRHPAGSRP